MGIVGIILVVINVGIIVPVVLTSAGESINKPATLIKSHSTVLSTTATTTATTGISTTATTTTTAAATKTTITTATTTVTTTTTTTTTAVTATTTTTSVTQGKTELPSLRNYMNMFLTLRNVCKPFQNVFS